jgi:cytochrome P450 family 6
VNLVSKTIEEREKHNIVRKDLIQYLIQLRNGAAKTENDDDEWKIESDGDKIQIMKTREVF